MPAIAAKSIGILNELETMVPNSLMIYGDQEKSVELLTDVLNITDENKIPYMGWQYEENIFWPNEKPSWTAAALIIAADTVLNFSNASNLFLENQLSLY